MPDTPTSVSEQIEAILDSFDPLYNSHNDFIRRVPKAKAAIEALVADEVRKAELYGRLNQIIELFRNNDISAIKYSHLHRDITDQLAALSTKEGE